YVLVVDTAYVIAECLEFRRVLVVSGVYPSSGSPVVFNATTTGGVSPYTFSWDFGDGLASTGSTVTHTFSTGGTFTVVLTVTDARSEERRVGKWFFGGLYRRVD